MNITMQEAAKAWGEGKDVEWFCWHATNGIWKPISKTGFAFSTHIEYRLKPEVTTSLSTTQLRTIYFKQSGFPDAADRPHDPDSPVNTALKAVANAAIRQYIKEQQV